MGKKFELGRDVHCSGCRGRGSLWSGSLLVLSMLLSTTPTSAQPLYNNLVSPHIDTRNNSTAYLNAGFIINSSRVNSEGQTVQTSITQMMSDDLRFSTSSVNSANIEIDSLSFAVTNSSTSAQSVRVHLRIWEDNHNTSVPPYASVSNDSPGTLLASYDLGEHALAAGTANANRNIASVNILNFDSSMLGDLTLPGQGGATTKYWFGLFFEKDGQDAATQALLQRVGVAFYDLSAPGTTGFSADVHHETDVFARNSPSGFNYQASRFDRSFGDRDNDDIRESPNDGNGAYIQFKQIFNTQTQVQSNFGWSVNGVFLIPEPSASGYCLLGIPFLATLIRRKRK